MFHSRHCQARKILHALAAATALAGAGAAGAASLEVIGTATYKSGTQNLGTYNLVYDPGSSLVWLDYTRSASTETAIASWASSLNGAGVLTYNLAPAYSNVSLNGTWRLPTSVVGTSYGYNGTTALGYNIASSELGHLYYTELGDIARYDANGVQNASWGYNPNSFFGTAPQNFKQGIYWSGTDDTPLDSGNKKYFFEFSTFDGAQQAGPSTTNSILGVAVQTVSLTSAVPEPTPQVLMLAGLVAVGFIARRRRDF